MTIFIIFAIDNVLISEIKINCLNHLIILFIFGYHIMKLLILLTLGIQLVFLLDVLLLV